jgi:hypothetical protein
VGRRKQLTLATPVPCQRLHVTILYQDRRKEQAAKKLKFHAARAPESLCKEKTIIISKPAKEEPRTQ